MKKFILFIHFLLIIVISGHSQEGSPMLTHFKESSDIENQSWAICHDENNVMLFANRRGIMIFDGQNWDFVRTPSIAFSLLYDTDSKRVYAGCDNDYGYLGKDSKGLYNYYSLSGDTAGVGLVEKIFVTDSTVCFYSDMTISRHNLETGNLECRLTSKANEPFTGMFNTPRNMFVNVQSKGLFRVEADTLFPIVTGYLLVNEEVLFSLPYDDKMVLLGLGSSSLSLFDGIKFYDYKIKDEGYLLQNILSDGVVITDNLYAFSTIDGGAIVIERKSGKLVSAINYQNGLPDDEVFAMGSDGNNGLWLSHQYGLSRADLQLPIGNFTIYTGLKGNLITSVWHNNELYVATSEGVFYLATNKNYSDVEIVVRNDKAESSLPEPAATNSQVQDVKETQKSKRGLLTKIFGKKLESTAKENIQQPEVKNSETKAETSDRKKAPEYVKKTVSRLKSINYAYKKVDGLNEKCKQLVSTPCGILVSTNMGLFSISDHNAKVIVKDQYINYIGKKCSDNKYFIATDEGYFYIIANDGKWTSVFPDRNFSEPLYSVTSLANGTLWAGGYNYAYRISGKGEGSPGQISKYAVKNDFPIKYIVENINDTIFLITESGISFFDDNSDSFNSYNRPEINPGSKPKSVFSQPDAPWYRQGDEWIMMSADESVSGGDKALLKVFNEILSVNLTRDYLWVIAEENKLFRIARNNNMQIKNDLDLYVRGISNEDGQKFDLTDIVFTRGDNAVFVDLASPAYLKQNSIQYQYRLEEIMNDWSRWSNASTITLMPPPGSYTLKVRAKDIWGNICEPRVLAFTIKPPFTKTTFFYLIILVLIFFIVFTVVRFREASLRKDKMILEEKVKERTAEIEAQKQEITSSIEYASRIQMAMLPADELFNNSFSDHFVIFKPRNIVSGDFYWIGEDEHRIFFTVADCTGHGVPGAFMSTLGISALNEIITNNKGLKANTVLGFLRDKVKTSLNQTGKDGEASDGMDIAFCALHKNRKILEFSGAYNPLILFRNGEMLEYKADRMPIGIHYVEKDSFTNTEISIKKGDILYLFSDGFADQFGGDTGTKYKISKLKKLLAGMHNKPMSEQCLAIENEFERWRGSNEQVDDVTIIGIRI